MTPPLPLPGSARFPPRRRRRAEAALLCLAAGPLWAQTPPAPAQAASAPEAAQLEPVVVSGSGLEQRVFDTPYAVDVVDADELRAAGPMVNLSEAMSRVPGLTVNLRNNYAQDLQISSRGFGARAAFGIRGMRLYTDGIPASMPDGSGQVSHFDLAGAQRIEVLRGPFSALYGNSSGGVITLVSRWPTERAAEVGVDVGSDGLRQLRVAAEAPLGNGWDIRVQGSKFETDGVRPHSHGERKLANLRLGWRGELDTVLLLVNAIDQPAQDPLGLTRDDFDADPYQATPQAEEFNTRKDLRQTQLGGQWRHRFAGGGALYESALTAYTGRRSVTQWQAIPVAAQTNPNSPNHPGGVIDFDRDYYGVDGRLVWRWLLPGDRAAQLIAGLSADQQDENRRGYRNYIEGRPDQPGVTGALRRKEMNRVRTADAYAQGELELAKDVSATLGLRSGRLRFSSRDRYLANGDSSGSRDFNYTNPVAALQWRATPQLNVYVSAGRGFESPTLNELAYRPGGAPGFNSELKPQRSRQLEIGAKWRHPEARLAIDTAIFRADTSDEIGVLSNDGGRSVYQNVGRTRRQGVEASARWEATRTLRTVLALTYLDARYRDDFDTCAGPGCAEANEQVPAGNRIAGTSRQSAYAEIAWRALAATEFALELRAQGKVPVDDLNSDFAAGVATAALRAQHMLPLGPGQLELLARIDNIADREYAGSVIVNESNGRFFETAAGRTLLLSAKWRMLF